MERGSWIFPFLVLFLKKYYATPHTPLAPFVDPEPTAGRLWALLAEYHEFFRYPCSKTALECHYCYEGAPGPIHGTV